MALPNKTCQRMLLEAHEAESHEDPTYARGKNDKRGKAIAFDDKVYVVNAANDEYTLHPAILKWSKLFTQDEIDGIEPPPDYEDFEVVETFETKEQFEAHKDEYHKHNAAGTLSAFFSKRARSPETRTKPLIDRSPLRKQRQGEDKAPS